MPATLTTVTLDLEPSEIALCREGLARLVAEATRARGGQHLTATGRAQMDEHLDRLRALLAKLPQDPSRG